MAGAAQAGNAAHTCTWKSSFTRSSGAVAVRAMTPAMPPAAAMREPSSTCNRREAVLASTGSAAECTTVQPLPQYTGVVCEAQPRADSMAAAQSPASSLAAQRAAQESKHGKTLVAGDTRHKRNSKRTGTRREEGGRRQAHSPRATAAMRLTLASCLA